MHYLSWHFLLSYCLLPLCWAVEQPTEYVIIPKDKSDKKIAEIEAYIKDITHSNDIFSQTSIPSNAFLWWITSLNPSQLDTIKRHDDVLAVEENHRIRHDIPDSAKPLQTRNKLRDDQLELQNFSAISKRDLTTFSIQRNAPKELRQISIPKDKTDLTQYPDFIYEDKAGEDIYIYITDLVSTAFYSLVLTTLSLFSTNYSIQPRVFLVKHSKMYVKI